MKRQAGFTLMEMLVSMTLLSLLLLALFGGLRFVRAGQSRTDAVIEEAEAMDVIRLLLVRQLANEFPVSTADAPPRPLFTARADRLAFPILRQAAAGPAGLTLAVFDIVSENGQSKLVYREYPFKPGGVVQVAETPVRSTELITGAAPMRFRYGGGSGDWQDSWNPQSPAPRLVGFSNPPWPMLVAAAKAETPP